MNRPIKFRAWDRKRMWPDVQDVYDDVDCIWVENREIQFDNGECQLVGLYSFGEVLKSGIPVMQYTGFKDQNGKAIYEGDILEIIDWDEALTNVPKPTAWDKGSVDFRNGAFRIHAYVLAEVVSFVEIIGNIYENPELLNG